MMALAYDGDQSDSTNAIVARDAFLRALDDQDLELKVRERDTTDRTLPVKWRNA